MYLKKIVIDKIKKFRKVKRNSFYILLKSKIDKKNYKKIYIYLRKNVNDYKLVIFEKNLQKFLTIIMFEFNAYLKK